MLINPARAKTKADNHEKFEFSTTYFRKSMIIKGFPLGVDRFEN